MTSFAWLIPAVSLLATPGAWIAFAVGRREFSLGTRWALAIAFSPFVLAAQVLALTAVGFPFTPAVRTLAVANLASLALAVRAHRRDRCGGASVSSVLVFAGCLVAVAPVALRRLASGRGASVGSGDSASHLTAERGQESATGVAIVALRVVIPRTAVVQPPRNAPHSASSRSALDVWMPPVDNSPLCGSARIELQCERLEHSERPQRVLLLDGGVSPFHGFMSGR